MSRSEKQHIVVTGDNEASAQVGEKGRGRTVQQGLYRANKDRANVFLSTIRYHGKRRAY